MGMVIVSFIYILLFVIYIEYLRDRSKSCLIEVRSLYLLRIFVLVSVVFKCLILSSYVNEEVVRLSELEEVFEVAHVKSNNKCRILYLTNFKFNESNTRQCTRHPLLPPCPTLKTTAKHISYQLDSYPLQLNQKHAPPLATQTATKAYF